MAIARLQCGIGLIDPFPRFMHTFMCCKRINDAIFLQGLIYVNLKSKLSNRAIWALSFSQFIVVCSCMYAFLWKWDPMCTPSHLGVRIGSHFNKNAYMHEQTTIEFGVRIVDRKNLNWCTPFFDVNMCEGQTVLTERKNKRRVVCIHEYIVRCQVHPALVKQVHSWSVFFNFK